MASFPEGDACDKEVERILIAIEEHDHQDILCHRGKHGVGYVKQICHIHDMILKNVGFTLPILTIFTNTLTINETTGELWWLCDLYHSC